MLSDIPTEILVRLGVDKNIINALYGINIKNLRKFQYEAIRKGLKGKSLIVVAPTGSGKTLIGEVLAVNMILKDGWKVFYLTPYKALAEEIASTFRLRYPINVGVATGDYRDVPLRALGMHDLIVLTYEKTDHIFREKPSWLESVKLAIVDEIHLLGDPKRGPLLDIVLTYMKDHGIQIIGLSATILNPEDISEWLNAELVVSDFRPVKLLECIYIPPESKMIIYDPRPNEAEQYFVTNNDLIEPIKKEKTLDEFLAKREKTNKIPLDNLLGENYKIISVSEGIGRLVARRFKRTRLCQYLEKKYASMIGSGGFYVKRVRTAHGNIRSTSFMVAILDILEDMIHEMQKYGQKWQLLVFRRSRSLAQKTAKKIAEFMKTRQYYILYQGCKNVADRLKNEIQEPTLLTMELIDTTSYGVGFHHAGLSRLERQIIEEAFRAGHLAVLVATPTLAAGVNLPARRVIIEHKYYEPEYGGVVDLSTADYKQRGGRAGRPNYDKVGEAILIAKNRKEMNKFIEKYVLGQPEAIKPISGHIPPIVYSQILALVVMESMIDKRRIYNFFEDTFFYNYSRRMGDIHGLNVLESNIRDGLRFLVDNGLILRVRKGRRIYYQATEIGRVLVRLYLKPTSAKTILDTLKSWRNSKESWDSRKVMQILFAVVSSPENWTIIRKLLSKFDALIDYIYEHETIVRDLAKEHNILGFIIEGSTSREFFTADEEEIIAIAGGICILKDWIEGKPTHRILDRFLPNFGPGDLSEFIRISDWLLHCSAELANSLKLSISTVENLRILSRMVRHGVPKYLLEIVEEVEGIGRTRALALKRAGFDSFETIARASIESLKTVAGIGDVLARRLKDAAARKVGLIMN